MERGLEDMSSILKVEDLVSRILNNCYIKQMPLPLR